MKVKNQTADERGFGSDVIGPGETLEVGAAAAEWFLRHGCVDADGGAPAADEGYTRASLSALSKSELSDIAGSLDADTDTNAKKSDMIDAILIAQG